MLVCTLLVGCGGVDSFRSADRAARLMAMAAAHASDIESPRERLTRQLNIANLQNQEGRAGDARATLTQAAQTIRQAEDGRLDEHTRMAGWVSISELSRRAGDRRSAGGACDEALALLRSIQPPDKRCRYVRGVAHEARLLRGKKASAAILRESGDWAQRIRDRAERRKACTVIASDLFLCDDYRGGDALLRHDDDAAWRSDILLQLAKSAIPQKSYGSSLNFERVFYRSKFDSK